MYASSSSTTPARVTRSGEVVDTEDPRRPFGDSGLGEQAQQPSPASLQLLSAGAISDRIGASRAFTIGLSVFTLMSVLCG
ncbi:hypothetical protein AB0J38_45715, partial [Streptomyces sp. NPDC050095]|uniref:hypothetical protein n=1 Tax=unclassified Streptomyces TaxID=2593676 RepID=UPI0034484A77